MRANKGKRIFALLLSIMVASNISSGCAFRTEKTESMKDNQSTFTAETPGNVSPKETSSFSSDLTEKTSDSSKNRSDSSSNAGLFYVTGAETVSLYSSSDASEVTGELKYSTEVTALSDTKNEYIEVTTADKKTRGFVSKSYLTSDRSSVTNGITAQVGENGASVYDEDGNLIENVYTGAPITIIAKTSGGKWRVKTEYGNIGYISITDIAPDSVPDTASQNGETTQVITYQTYTVEQSGTENQGQPSVSYPSDLTSGTPSDVTRSSVSVSSDPTVSNEPSDPDSVLGEALGKAQNSVGGNWAAYYIDLSTGESSSMNSSSMQAASLIKLYIMGAIYEDYETYSAQEPNLDSWLYSMITVSDNYAANNLVRVLGGGSTDAGKSAVTSYCTSHGYYNSSMGRLLLESNLYGDNYTSVSDCAHFLASVYNGELPHSSEMMNLLSQQTVTTKIPAGVPVRTANKTGELASVQNDAAIVFADSPYVLCVMSENVPAGMAVSAISQLSSTVYYSR